MRDDRERLQDILEAIERIERYSVQGREAFEQNELIQTWFIQNLQVIGEASRSNLQNPRSPKARSKSTTNPPRFKIDACKPVQFRSIPRQPQADSETRSTSLAIKRSLWLSPTLWEKLIEERSYSRSHL